MSILRLTAIALLLAASQGGEAALAVEPAPVKPESVPPIEFYLAKGEANACGPGCSEWISADGRFTAGAAQRLRHLLAKLGRAHPPVFFHSPGGLVTEGLEIGRIIREQKLTTSVGHTVPVACVGDQAAQKTCDAQKQSGQAIEAALDPLTSMCNSACVYAFAGGAVRLVPPGVQLAIHDVGLDPSAAPQSKAVAAQGKRVAHEHIEEYLHDMGIDEGLYRAAAAIPFESKKFLERDEVVRFGIDKREFGESPWRMVDKPSILLAKRFFWRSDNDQQRYVDGFVSLNCGMLGDIRLSFGRRHGAALTAANALPGSASITASGRRIDLLVQISSPGYDLRTSSLTAAEVALLSGAEATLQLPGTDLVRADDAKGSMFLDMSGFPDGFAKLRTSCSGVAGDAKSTVAHSTVPKVASSPTPSPGPGASPALETHLDAAPLAEPAVARSSASPACGGKIPSEPQHVTGRVTAFLSDEDAQERTRMVEISLGLKSSAAYASLPRVNVVRSDGRGSTMASIPENMTVKLGDMVELNSRRWDQNIPCAFIPWTINRLIDRVQ
jgi:hypothetical protein